jgi:methyl-accepting chemotaxis protein
VEEQRAVTADISRTINESSEGTANIAASFKQVADLAYESLSVTDKGREAAEQLSTMAIEIEQMISHFSLDSNLRTAVK